ncbi:hypothetical protein D9757_007239 [Collybiopsis confluens]|uniref:Bromo domain-containing protein n=1 Tax=Collybiopsis confluens TaxID=2823264 RepID=A0A8H5HB26_9AGAR|nr:hypothetical protein D9757_007239 [Collybiopsis confluens]
MTLSPSQKASIASVLNDILTAVAPPPSKQKTGELGVGGHGAGSGRGRRRVLSAMFLTLLDRNDWAEYYELIPNPRALHPIRDMLAEDKYTDALEVFTDLSLVFWNAIFYNEKDRHVSTKDAAVLKDLLHASWAKYTDLPQPRSHSPPPESAQKAYPEVEVEEKRKEEDRERQKELDVELERKEKEKEAQVQEVLVKVDDSAPIVVDNGPVVDIVEVEEVLNETSESEGDNADPPDSVSLELGVDYHSLDIDNDTIVRHLDSSLPRWPGFDQCNAAGWLVDGNTEVYSALLHAIKGHKDVVGNRFASALEAIPDTIKGPTAATREKPISLKVIEARVKSNSYSTAASFDADMMLLFEKGRRWWEPTPTNSFTPPGKPSPNSKEEYAKLLILQRLYQALTSLVDRPALGLPYSSETNFASLRVGPGRVNGRVSDAPNVTSGSKGIETITTGRISLDQVRYKGWTMRVGDWVHLANGSDGSSGRPIVAQVWKVWKKVNESESGSGQVPEDQYGVTVCWYYRPQETFHSPTRVFWENEVFKSNHFASHPISDVIEPIFVQSSRDHIRGRPRGVEWYPGWPLYICDSRYSYSKGQRAYRNYVKSVNGQLVVKKDPSSSSPFARIKNWNLCMPPELLENQPSKMSKLGRSVFTFERTVFPRRLSSPFVGGSASGAPGALVQDDGSDDRGPTKGALIGLAANAGAINGVFQQYANAGSYQAYLQYYSNQQHAAASPTAVTAKSSKPDRTMTASAAAHGSQFDLTKLPSETTCHFTRDPETGLLLWFSAPPVNAPGRRAATTPGHSLSYLHWRAMKLNSAKKGGQVRETWNEGTLGKRKGSAEEAQVNGVNGSMDNGSEYPDSLKKQKQVQR